MKKPLLFTFLSFLSPLLSDPAFHEIEDTCRLHILNPALQSRKTAKMQLENGLQIYLISDEKADQSAAAIAVQAGHWNDPREYPGMAHFLEHMLFMGTAAYPGENEFMSFVADHGGKTNAYTSSDRTVYMFSINNGSFTDGLDRFAHFFIDPLFDPSGVNRELHNVDQEHAKNIENDNWRKYMIMKETGNPNHPNAGFSTGNSQTLSIIPPGDLRKWYENNYSASLMNLIVYSSLPLEELKQSVAKSFSSVPNTKAKKLAIEQTLSSEKQKGRITYIKPIKNMQRLSLEWELPAGFLPDDTKSAKLIAYALERGSKNSLYEKLKKEGLVQDFEASYEKVGQHHLMFALELDLTHSGMQKIPLVIERCFQAINGLKEKGIPSYLFQEMQTMSKLNYEYQTREDPFRFVMQYAGHLSDENLASFPEKTILPVSFDPKTVQAMLASLTPQNCQYYVVADPEKTGVKPEKKEKWMGGEYAILDVSPNLLAEWSKIPAHPEIQIASPNPFLPTKLELLSAEKDSITPVKILSNDYATAYYAKDAESPEVVLYLHFLSREIQKTPKSAALTDLYLKHLTEALAPTLASAGSAGLKSSFSTERCRLNLTISGYSEKAGTLAAAIFKEMRAAKPTAEEFQIYKDYLLRIYENAGKEMPLVQAIELLSSLMKEKTLAQEKLAALKELTYQDYLDFQAKLFQSAFLEATLTGNLTIKEAEGILLDSGHILGYSPYAKAERIQEKVIALPDGKGPFVISEKTSAQGNAVILLLEEGTFSFAKRAAQQTLSIALKDGFFTALRSKQKTAYIAQTQDEEAQKKLFQIFAVQSNSHQPEDLLYRFELFIEDFAQEMPSYIPEDRFLRIKENLITNLKLQGRNLEERAKLWDTLAFQYEGDFDWMNKRIKGLQDLSYQEFLSLSQTFLSRANKQRLGILYKGKLSKQFAYEGVTPKKLKEICTYETGQIENLTPGGRS